MPSETWSVPVVIAGPPGHVAREGSEHVEEAPGDDHVVVDSRECGHSKHSPSNA